MESNREKTNVAIIKYDEIGEIRRSLVEMNGR